MGEIGRKRWIYVDWGFAGSRGNGIDETLAVSPVGLVECSFGIVCLCLKILWRSWSDSNNFGGERVER